MTLSTETSVDYLFRFETTPRCSYKDVTIHLRNKKVTELSRNKIYIADF